MRRPSIAQSPPSVRSAVRKSLPEFLYQRIVPSFDPAKPLLLTGFGI